MYLRQVIRSAPLLDNHPSNQEGLRLAATCCVGNDGATTGCSNGDFSAVMGYLRQQWRGFGDPLSKCTDNRHCWPYRQRLWPPYNERHEDTLICPQLVKSRGAINEVASVGKLGIINLRTLQSETHHRHDVRVPVNSSCQ